MSRERSGWLVSACAVALWVTVAASAWGAPVERADEIHVAPVGAIRFEKVRATPAVGVGAASNGVLPEALMVGTVGLLALGMGTALIFGRGQEW
jgi:hypothetical protein